MQDTHRKTINLNTWYDVEVIIDTESDKFAQFASTDCLFRMNGLGSSVEADWGCGVFLSCVFMR